MLVAGMPHIYEAFSDCTLSLQVCYTFVKPFFCSLNLFSSEMSIVHADILQLDILKSFTS